MDAFAFENVLIFIEFLPIPSSDSVMPIPFKSLLSMHDVFLNLIGMHFLELSLDVSIRLCLSRWLSPSSSESQQVDKIGS